MFVPILELWTSIITLPKIEYMYASQTLVLKINLKYIIKIKNIYEKLNNIWNLRFSCFVNVCQPLPPPKTATKTTVPLFFDMFHTSQAQPRDSVRCSRPDCEVYCLLSCDSEWYLSTLRRTCGRGPTFPPPFLFYPESIILNYTV